MKNYFLLVPVVLLHMLYSIQACAEIYKNVDANGHITYSNIPSKGSTKLDLGLSPKPSPESGTVRSAPTRMATPSNFPRVDKQTQSLRDTKRKSILQTELDTESKSLLDAKKSLAEIDSSIGYLKANGGKAADLLKLQEKSKLMQSDIDNHQSNIRLLQKELSSTK